MCGYFTAPAMGGKCLRNCSDFFIADPLLYSIARICFACTHLLVFSCSYSLVFVLNCSQTSELFRMSVAVNFIYETLIVFCLRSITVLAKFSWLLVVPCWIKIIQIRWVPTYCRTYSLFACFCLLKSNVLPVSPKKEYCSRWVSVWGLQKWIMYNGSCIDIFTKSSETVRLVQQNYHMRVFIVAWGMLLQENYSNYMSTVSSFFQKWIMYGELFKLYEYLFELFQKWTMYNGGAMLLFLITLKLPSYTD